MAKDMRYNQANYANQPQPSNVEARRDVAGKRVRSRYDPYAPITTVNVAEVISDDAALRVVVGALLDSHILPPHVASQLSPWYTARQEDAALEEEEVQADMDARDDFIDANGNYTGTGRGTNAQRETRTDIRGNEQYTATEHGENPLYPHSPNTDQGGNYPQTGERGTLTEIGPVVTNTGHGQDITPTDTATVVTTDVEERNKLV